MSPPRTAISLVVLLALLAGCGVPPERDPRPLDPPSGAYRTLAASAEAGPATEQLCLVKDDKLVVVERRLRQQPTANTLLRHLFAGPTKTESDAGLTSALTATNVLDQVQVTAGAATVDVGSRLDAADRSDEVLAYGQIVCTLDTLSTVDTIAFYYHQQPLGVPRADGSLSDGPLTAADYASLMSAR